MHVYPILQRLLPKQGTRSPKGSQPPPLKNERLRSHLAENRDYLFFVGVPLDSPEEWKRAPLKCQTFQKVFER